MKKKIKSIVAVITSVALLSGTVPISGYAYETGTIDNSDIVVEYGELKAMNLKMNSMPEILANDEIENYSLGAYLDANNKAVYDAFVKLATPSLQEFTVILPETVSFQTDDIESSENTEFYNAVFSTCASGMEAASFDTPWNFWNDQNGTTVSPGNMRYKRNWLTGVYTFYIDKLTFAPAAYEGFESFEQVFEYQEKLEEAVENFVVEGETREQQIKSIHDQICYFTDYDVNGRFRGSALSALVEPGAVCEGYAKGFKIICDKLGIPTVCIFGNYDEAEASAHMWNYVQMEDGKWYAIDVTWDDYDGDKGLDIIYRYYLKGSEKFFTNHTEVSDYNLIHLEYPEISASDYCEQYADVKVTTAPIVTPVTTTTSTITTTTTTTTKTIPATTSSKITTVKTVPMPLTTSKPKSTTTTKKITTTTTTKSTPKPVTTVPAPLYEKGDINRDGKITIADLVTCAYQVLGSVESKYSCDLNDDNVVDVFDVIIMRKIFIAKSEIN